MARIFSAEQIFPFFFDHIFQEHAAQLRNGTFLIADPEKAVNITEFVKLISCPTLKLFFRQSTSEQELPNRMGPRMALLQRVLQVFDQFLRSEHVDHNSSLRCEMRLFVADDNQVEAVSPGQFILSFHIPSNSMKPWFRSRSAG
jgi:hypothetical protein